MNLLEKPLNEITKKDIMYLKDEEISESRILDYKLKLPDDNKELIADIIAFANTDGGVIVYGVEEKQDDNGKNTGIPNQIVGLGDLNLDAEQLRIENTLRDSVDPRLPGIEFHTVDVPGGKVLLVGIPRSLFAPHMSKRDSKFYARNNSGKFSMDVQQIRQAFSQTENWEGEADNFRRNRVMDVLSGKNNYLSNREQVVFLHIMPLGRKSKLIDVKDCTNDLYIEFKPYMYSRQCNAIYNLNGYLLWSGISGGQSYTQFFRNGTMEIATSFLFCDPMNPKQIQLDGTQLERFVIEYVKKYISFSKRHSIQPPFAVYISVIGAKCKIKGEYPSIPGDFRVMPVNGALNYNEILFPAVVLESLNQDENLLSNNFRNIFDMLWQAAGNAGSPHYRNNGTWGICCNSTI